MSRTRVLIADDDPLARRFIAEALASFGAGTSEVASGAEAVAALRGEFFDIVFADLRMPGPSGAELARALLDGSGNRPPRLFAMSAELDAAERERLVAAGYADALSKPLSRGRLGALLDPGSGPAFDAPPSLAVEPAARPVLDDDAALRALGSRATVIAMRGLLLKDLPAQRTALAEDIRAGKRAAAAASLHRLRAACGYCGAARLDEATFALRRLLEGPPVDVGPLHRAWEARVRELEEALAQR